tara:strand:- start:73 stop:1047 length:975 start_codon:yes stop_codon:yes gene_type:complete
MQDSLCYYLPVYPSGPLLTPYHLSHSPTDPKVTAELGFAQDVANDGTGAVHRTDKDHQSTTTAEKRNTSPNPEPTTPLAVPPTPTFPTPETDNPPPPPLLCSIYHHLLNTHFEKSEIFWKKHETTIPDNCLHDIRRMLTDLYLFQHALSSFFTRSQPDAPDITVKDSIQQAIGAYTHNDLDDSYRNELEDRIRANLDNLDCSLPANLACSGQLRQQIYPTNSLTTKLLHFLPHFVFLLRFSCALQEALEMVPHESGKTEDGAKTAEEAREMFDKVETLGASVRRLCEKFAEMAKVVAVDVKPSADDLREACGDNLSHDSPTIHE